MPARFVYNCCGSLTMAMSEMKEGEVSRLGNDLYERELRVKLDTPENKGRLVALDIRSGEYAMGRDSMTVTNAVLARQPNAMIHLLRIGHRTAFSFDRLGRRKAMIAATEPDEIVRKGKDRYETELRSRLDTPENQGRLVALDIDSGDYEVGRDTLQLFYTLRARQPESRVYLHRIGSTNAFSLGGGVRR